MQSNKQAFPNARRANLFRFDPADLVLIEDPEHPLFDERVNLPVDEALVRNIAMHGVIEPVIIAKLGEQPVVVDGRQRVKAAREASDRLKKEGSARILVPCKIHRGNAEGLLGVSVSANEHRRDDSTLGKAHKMLRLLEIGRTEPECADIFGVTTHTIASWIKLVELPKAVLDAVDREQLSASAASALHGLDHAECKVALEKLLADAGPGKKRQSRSKVNKALGKAGFKFRSSKAALAAVPKKYHEAVKPYLEGTTVARVASIIKTLQQYEGIEEEPAFLALKALVEKK